MFFKDRGRKAARKAAVMAASAAVASGLLAAPIANAQTSGNIVVLGDSFTSSPKEEYNFVRGSSTSSNRIPKDYPRTGGCLQDPQNWPRQMQRRTGVRVYDWSCTAESSSSFLARLDAARKAGNLNRGTRAVFIAVGGNDFGPWGIGRGHNPFDMRSQQATYNRNIGIAKARIKAVAPNAEIVIAGYPEVSDGNQLCLFNTIPGAPIGVPFPGFGTEGAIRQLQRNGAARHGLKFVDNYALTRGHNTCTRNDKQRYVNGWLDTTSTRQMMPLHPTVLGHSVLAANNARAIGL